MNPNLDRLERLIVIIMRTGVALSAAALIGGLALTWAGVSSGANVIKAGLIVLMAVPAARIIVSFGDALFRRDVLIACATAIVAAVLLYQFLHPL